MLCHGTLVPPGDNRKEPPMDTDKHRFMKATNGWRMPRDSGADRRSPERVQEGECFVMGPWCRLAITGKNHRWTPIYTDFYATLKQRRSGVQGYCFAALRMNYGSRLHGGLEFIASGAIFSTELHQISGVSGQAPGGGKTCLTLAGPGSAGTRPGHRPCASGGGMQPPARCLPQAFSSNR